MKLNQDPNLKSWGDDIERRLATLERAGRFTFPPVSTDPATPVIGDAWLNTALNGLKVVDANGAVQQLNLGIVTSFVPVITSQTGTLGSVTGVAGTYSRIGKICTFTFTFTITTVGTGSNGLFITLPFVAGSGMFVGAVRENAAIGAMGQVYTSTGGANAVIFKYDNSTLIAAGYTIIGTLTYLTT